MSFKESLESYAAVVFILGIALVLIDLLSGSIPILSTIQALTIGFSGMNIVSGLIAVFDSLIPLLLILTGAAMLASAATKQ